MLRIAYTAYSELYSTHASHLTLASATFPLTCPRACACWKICEGRNKPSGNWQCDPAVNDSSVSSAPLHTCYGQVKCPTITHSAAGNYKYPMHSDRARAVLQWLNCLQVLTWTGHSSEYSENKASVASTVELELQIMIHLYSEIRYERPVTSVLELELQTVFHLHLVNSRTQRGGQSPHSLSSFKRIRLQLLRRSWQAPHAFSQSSARLHFE